MTDIRYGIIGSGMMGQEHIRTIGLLEGARVTAVCDPDEGCAQRRAHGGRGLRRIQRP
jgi:myo-inositol 2-dehydrogenase/D-chiro-inositol 1-dehydrogenase